MPTVPLQESARSYRGDDAQDREIRGIHLWRVQWWPRWGRALWKDHSLQQKKFTS